MNSGGLIEAFFVRAAVIEQVTAKFPPVNSGGLIEAYAPRLSAFARGPGRFPPVNSGGLIEAQKFSLFSLETVVAWQCFRR